jgi:transposase
MKEITKEQFREIAKHLPVQRGNVAIDNLNLINALLYMDENGCKWRSLPEKYGKWSSVHKRISRWAKSGVLSEVFKSLQKEMGIDLEIVALDSTCVKVHPDGTGALKKTESRLLVKRKADGTQRFTWLPPMIVKS